MKKILLVISIMLVINPVMAKNIKVEALDKFSTANPPKTWKIKVLETFVADNGITIHQGTVIDGDIVNVKSPQRLKRNATLDLSLKHILTLKLVQQKLLKGILRENTVQQGI